MRRTITATCVDAALAFFFLSVAAATAIQRLGLRIFG